MKKIIYIIFIVVLAFILSLNVLSITHHSLFGFRVYRVKTGSMEPTLRIGSLIVIESQDEYQVGDIVTFKDNGGYTTHRIYAIIGDEIVTKGDANDTPDTETTNENRIVGKVVLNFMKNRFINYLLLEPFTWVLLLAFGLLITILIPNSFKREEKKEAPIEGS